jgi:hypothetical protein|tara:strand:- start:270 stop:530 length:261 start_codon:yes stop_codon:yes gene_type:complete
MLLLITPMMGALRNYTKYKDFKLLIFLRTPVIYFFLFLILQTKNIWKILIFERWFMFVYKTIRSVFKKDYILKKEKYIQKYGLKYK